MPKIQISFNEKQDRAWWYLQDKKVTQLLFGGGAGGGKSYLGAMWLITSCLQYAGTRWFIARKEKSKIKESTLLTLFDILANSGFEPDKHYTYNDQKGIVTFITTNSTINLIELDWTPSDPMYERIGSTEYTGGFIDEAGEISSRARDAIFSRIRYKIDDYDLIPKLLMSCNPSQNFLYEEFYQPWKHNKLPENKQFIQSLVQDNKYISSHYITSLQNIKDRVMRERLLQGSWEYSKDERQIFNPEDIFNAWSLPSVDNTGKRYLTCDVARFGRDKSVIIVWHNLEAVEIQTIDSSDLMYLSSVIDTIRIRNNILMSNVLVDEAGVGGGVVDKLKCTGFVGGSSPFKRRKKGKNEYEVHYKNLRAQCYFTLAEYMRRSKIKLNSEDEQLKQSINTELQNIRRKITGDSKLAIDSKDEIKKTLGRSPDYADAISMRMYFIVGKKKKPRIIYSE